MKKIGLTISICLLFSMCSCSCSKHEHTYATEYKYDENYHWFEYTCGCRKQPPKYKHTMRWSTGVLDDSNENATEYTQEGYCIYCKYKTTRTVTPEKNHVHTFYEGYQYNHYEHWQSASCGCDLRRHVGPHEFEDEYVIDLEASENDYGYRHKSCKICGYDMFEEYSIYDDDDRKFITIYSFNDFNGAVNQDATNKEPGLARFATYLSIQNREESLIIDNGDTFQGSFESGYNKGALISTVFNEAHVDIHNLGDEDFCWGQDAIKANYNRKSTKDGFRMTNLASNTFNYDSNRGVEGNTQQSELGAPYYVKTMANGVKVGVVGACPENLITSINANNVNDICFKEYVKTLQNYSDMLRRDKLVDVTICAIHNSADDTFGMGLTDISPYTSKPYFDYVICGHSKQREQIYDSSSGISIPYTQTEPNGRGVYVTTIYLNKYNNITDYNLDYIDYRKLMSEAYYTDGNIENIIYDYTNLSLDAGGEVLNSEVVGNFTIDHMSHLMCTAIHYEAKEEGYDDIFGVVCEGAEIPLSKQSWVYEDLYNAFPNDYKIYIAKIRFKNLQNAFGYANGEHNRYIYHIDVDTVQRFLWTDEWQIVAIPDYLLFHQNLNREYDYFSFNDDEMEIIDVLEDVNGNALVHRDICANFIKHYPASSGLNSSTYDPYKTKYKCPTFYSRS